MCLTKTAFKTFDSTRRASVSRSLGTVASPSKNSPSDHILSLQRTIGNQAVGKLLRSGGLQAKLTIGEPNDVYEKEADRMAVPPSMESSIRSLSGKGEKLSPSERSFFEPRFGVDLSSTRLHSGDHANELTAALHARAFTVGNDVVLGTGQYSPGTSEGRRLLGHELTHVVQQTGQPSRPDIQRNLLVTGKPKDVKALLDLLEPPSGFILKHDANTKEVSIKASRLKPASSVLAGLLAMIMDDPAQDAELNLGRNQLAVGFGAFPFSEQLIQIIDIDDMERLEARVPGSGVAFLIHEIVENYHAHKPSLRDFHRQVVFAESHKEALEAERLVAEELVGRPGGRVADAVTTIGPDTLRNVHDYEHYFLVIDYRRGVLTSARQVSRINVSRYTIGGFTRDVDVLPPATRTKIAAVAEDLAAHPAATVTIKSGDSDQNLALQRAEKVRDAILDAGKGRKGFDLRSWRNFNLDAFGLIDIGEVGTRGLVIITVDKPDIGMEAERGRLVKEVMAGRRK